MKKIEEKMVSAIQNREDFRRSNTVVEFEEDGDCHVYLFNNRIAHISADGTAVLQDCGYTTDTTKGRLNALLTTFHGSERIVQRRGEWFLSNEETRWKGFLRCHFNLDG